MDYEFRLTDTTDAMEIASTPPNIAHSKSLKAFYRLDLYAKSAVALQQVRKVAMWQFVLSSLGELAGTVSFLHTDFGLSLDDFFARLQIAEYIAPDIRALLVDARQRAEKVGEDETINLTTYVFLDDSNEARVVKSNLRDPRARAIMPTALRSTRTVMDEDPEILPSL